MLHCVLPILVLAGPPGEWFDLVIPPTDTSATYLDLSFLNPAPAGADGFVSVRDGRFVDGQGRRLRFFGTNLTFGAAFPTHELAEQLAGRLRKLGMNVVRLHHLDNRGAPAGLWLDNAAGTLDPEQLDRLCYLIFQLKQHGIWTNLNLHVSRNYPGIDFSKLPRTFNYGKVLDHYHPRLIDLQRQYASDLLGHVNPYTNARLADEPAIAMVELNNENTLLGAWRNTELANLPDDLRAPLEDGWRRFVAERHGTLEAATRAWTAGIEPLGDDLLANGDFAADTAGWSLEAPAPGRAEMAAVDGVLRATMTEPGRNAWDFQVHQLGLNLTNGAAYTVRFRARADAPRQISVNTRLQVADWSNVGLNAAVSLTTEWSTHQFVFTAANARENLSRLSFTLYNQPGTVEIDDVSLRRGAAVDLGDGVTLATLPLPVRTGLRGLQRDWIEYLVDCETRYVTTMRRHLRETLGVHAPIINSQASYGGVGGIAREAGLNDYIDMHSYWHHPAFPNRPWDPADWTVATDPLVAADDGGTMPRLACYRVADLPFTVSEYDHPAPMPPAHEMFAILTGIAAVQDWDGLFQFNWGSSAENLTADRLTGFFNLATHPAKLAATPLAALIFRQGLIPAAAESAELRLPRAGLTDLIADGTDAPRAWAVAGMEPGLVARRRMAVRLVDGDGPPTLAGPASPAPGAGILSDSDPVRWRADDGQELFVAVGASAVIVTGRLTGRQVTAGPVTIDLEPTPLGLATVLLAALDGRPLEQSRRLALSVCGASINHEMGWNEALTSVGNRWGRGPSRVEALRGTVRVRTEQALEITPLDGTGAPGGGAYQDNAAGAATVRVRPEDRAVWWALRAD